MRFLSAILSSIFIYVVFICFSVSQVSCSKTSTQYDTTYITKHDTTIKHDTTVTIKHDTTIIIDTICMSNLVAYYNFNNGNLNDSSGKGNNIAFSNATTTTDRFGRASNAYLFTEGSYMRVPNSASLNPALGITLMAIVKFNSFYTGIDFHNQIFMKGGADEDLGVYGLRAHPSLYDGMVSDTSVENFIGMYGDGSVASVRDGATTIQENVWYTIVYTYDGINTTFYVNGVAQATTSTSFSFTPNTNDLYIGKTENPTYPYNLEGAIDEIRIYNQALTASQVSAISQLTK